jgi:hypothetical protein
LGASRALGEPGETPDLAGLHAHVAWGGAIGAAVDIEALGETPVAASQPSVDHSRRAWVTTWDFSAPTITTTFRGSTDLAA